LGELDELQNLLLAYRLLHFRDKIPDTKLNIQNREKQLFKPVLRIFQNAETLNDLLPVISRYVSQKRESNTNTFHAFLYRTITELIKEQERIEIESSLIWNYITEILHREFNPNKKLSYESSEFGTISQKGMTETLLQVFGAKYSPNKREKRKLIFDLAKLERVGKLYDLALEVQVGKPGAHEADGVDIGLDRHLAYPSTDIEIGKSSPTNQNFYDKVELNTNKEITKEQPINAVFPVDPPQAPHPPRGELLSPLECSC
jgi:hypothetical protein